ncbi:MAG: hypothetical protein LUF92_00890 [Clostridiales bacterium]|nr:hypothetical protein [Clostridiales bacterium]
MFPNQFTSITFFQKKKDITLYKATDASHHYVIKSIITKDAAVKQAFYDEYLTLSTLRHPSIPTYFGISERFHCPDQTEEALALCIEDCSLPAPKGTFSLADIQDILLQTTDILGYLLDHGVLYTDLNPSNLIISRQDGRLFVRLLDYTYCYYFLRNPHPIYELRFSYNISLQLKGQPFLIQAMTWLFYELLESNQIEPLPSSVCQLLETGWNPSAELTLDDFSDMLRHSVR